MNFNGIEELQTPRLILRPFKTEDAPAMFRNWTSDDAVTKYLRWATHTSVKDTEALLKDWIPKYQQPDYFEWVITLKETDEPIGGISLLNSSKMDERAEVGYCLGRRWWNQGIMTEALKAVLEFAFQKVNYYRVQAVHSVQNPASGKVMEKAGMKFEANLAGYYKCGMGFQDVKIYAILNPYRD